LPWKEPEPYTVATSTSSFLKSFSDHLPLISTLTKQVEVPRDNPTSSSSEGASLSFWPTALSGAALGIAASLVYAVQAGVFTVGEGIGNFAAEETEVENLVERQRRMLRGGMMSWGGMGRTSINASAGDEEEVMVFSRKEPVADPVEVVEGLQGVLV
jgi:hypothetical protein